MTLHTFLGTQMAQHLTSVAAIEDDDNRHWCAGYRKAIDDIKGDIDIYKNSYGREDAHEEEYTGERCECGGRLLYSDGSLNPDGSLTGNEGETVCEDCGKPYWEPEYDE